MRLTRRCITALLGLRALCAALPASEPEYPSPRGGRLVARNDPEPLAVGIVYGLDSSRSAEYEADADMVLVVTGNLEDPGISSPGKSKVVVAMTTRSPDKPGLLSAARKKFQPGWGLGLRVAYKQDAAALFSPLVDNLKEVARLQRHGEQTLPDHYRSILITERGEIHVET